MHFIRPRSYCLQLLLFTLLFAFPTGVSAQDASQNDSPAPRIETDAERNAFIFIIDGEEIALLDKSGFYVRDSVVYGGTLTDAGSGWVNDYIVDGKPGAQEKGGDDDQ